MTSSPLKIHWIYISFIIMFLVSTLVGAGSMNIAEILIKGSNSNLFFFDSRLPRTISLVLAGFGLSISGLIFQQLSNNKFVSPTTAGSVSGAQLGLAVSMAYLGVTSTTGRMIFGMGFSLLFSTFFLVIINRLRYKPLIFVPLVGLMLSNIITALTTFIGYTFNFLQVLEGWFVGSSSLIISGRYELLYIVLPAVLLAFFFAREFTIIGLGEDFSKSIGINYSLYVTIGLVLISIISSTTIIIIGFLPFIGLIIPNIISMYYGDNLEKNVFLVGISGALFLLMCDLLSRVIIYPYELSVSLIMGVIGTIVFLLMIFSERTTS